MVIAINCDTCKKELSCTFNTRDESLEVEICPDCLEKEKVESYEQGKADAE